MERIKLLVLVFCVFISSTSIAQSENDTFRMGIAGLTHGHAHLLFRFKTTDSINIVGIVEPNKQLVQKYKQRYHLSDSLFFCSIQEMVQQVKPEGVAVFSSTKEHLPYITQCAAAGVDVMVEKPLSINFKEAKQIQSLAKKANIKVITNYETTWHPALDSCIYKLRNDGIGDLRKIVFHHGNNGTRHTKAPAEFVEWLTDSVKNGGGAIMDFGCYGLNIITEMTGGQWPNSIYAEANNYKPLDYPQVDDDALIVLNYDGFKCLIQASWNWAIPRKDMELYGSHGQAKAVDATTYKYQLNNRSKLHRVE
jgi:predicted dehydrogenase